MQRRARSATTTVLATIALVLIPACGDDPPTPAAGEVPTRLPGDDPDAASAPVPVQSSGPNVASVTAAQAAEGAVDLTAIRATLEELRSLSFRHDVRMAFEEREEFSSLVAEGAEADLGGGAADGREAGLKRLGLLGADVDLAEERAAAMSSQIAGWYDPGDGSFYLMGDLHDQDTIDLTAAHELVHALQDQHFGLGERLDTAGYDADGTRNDDNLFATRALVEGDATFVQLAWLADHLGKETIDARLSAGGVMSGFLAGLEMDRIVEFARQQVASMDATDSLFPQLDALADLDPYVAEPMFAAYARGAWFVHQVRTAGGWEAVDALYESPPTTAEHILHPRRFVRARDEPTPVAIPDLPAIDAARWRVADTAVHGELYLQMLLRRHGTPPTTAFKACSGWDGDRYRAWRNTDGDTAIVLATTWDTQIDATQFLAAYREIVASKYPGHRWVVDSDSADGGLATYRLDASGPAFGSAVRRGREVFVIEGFDEDETKAVLTTLRATPIEHVD